MTGAENRAKRRDRTRQRALRAAADASARTRRRDRPELQGSLGATIGWSILTIFLVACIVCVVLLCIPTSAVRNLWDAATSRTAVLSPSSYFYQTLLTKIHIEDALYVSPGSLFAGGLVFGRLVPLRFSRIRAVSTASAVMALVYAGCAVFSWGLDIWMSHGRGDWRHAAAQVIGVQLLAIAMATGASAIGTVIGVVWRDRAAARRA